MKIESFDKRNLHKIVEWVKPIWSMVDWTEDFKSLDVEFIVRHNIFENDFALQLTSNQELLAVAFAAGREEENDSLLWLEPRKKELPLTEQNSLQLVAEYLEYMDKKTCSLMKEDAIRLTLFASGRKGLGSLILDELQQRLRSAGFKTMYLWTDSDCNHQWYPQHGYTLVEATPYRAFSTPSRDFFTYIFCKDLK